MQIDRQIKVSIIVPIHNAGIHLKKCLDTLINQTLTEIEIILVLDCPTDGSDLIAEEYAKRDERIVILKNKCNLHIGKSRNEGLKIAKGEYIGFSDHDDFRELDMYFKLYTIGKKQNAEIVVSAYGFSKNNELIKVLYPDFKDKPIKDHLFDLIIGSNENINSEWNFFILNGGMWNKIYKNEFIRTNEIHFEDNRVTTFEDLLFLTSCYFHSKNISIINEVFYYHIEDIENSSSKYFYNSYKLISAYLINLNLFLKKNLIYDRYKLSFYNTVVNFVMTSIINEFYSKKLFLRKIIIFSYFRKLNFVKEAFRSRNSKNIFFPPRNLTTLYLRKFVFLFFRL